MVSGVLFVPAAGRAQAPRSPDLDVVAIFQVHDTTGWLALQEQAFAAPVHGTKVLQIAVTGGSGETRSVTIVQPRFTVSLVKGAQLFRVTVAGKISGGAGAAGLGAFEYGVLEGQQRSGERAVGIYYGLSSVAAELLELHVTRP